MNNKETNYINAPEAATHQDNSWKWAALAVGALLLVSVVCLIGCLIGGIVGVSLFGLRSSRHMQYPPESDRMPMPEAPEPWREPVVPDAGDPTLPLVGRAWLGVTYTMAETGAQIVEVTPGSPADQANLRVGDIVIAVEGTSLTTHRGLKELILRYKPGDEIELTILRDGREQNVSVRLGTPPPDIMQQRFPPED